jgi:transcriptional regulator with XRE-family HTH domain
MDGRNVDRDAARRLGKNVWMARRRAGFSQEALGSLCSLHRTEIGMIENGQRLPRVDTLLKVSAVLEVSVEKLLDGIEWMAPGPQVGGSFLVRNPA